MYYRISHNSYKGYLSLHVDLLTQCVDTPFAEVKTQIKYHSDKLLETRSLHSIRLQMIAHHCIYFRDGLTKGWQSLGLYKLALHTLCGSVGADEGGTGTTGAKTRVYSHCKTGLHTGNKENCP